MSVLVLTKRKVDKTLNKNVSNCNININAVQDHNFLIIILIKVMRISLQSQ
jgi:hypothetical protein